MIKCDIECSRTVDFTAQEQHNLQTSNTDNKKNENIKEISKENLIVKNV